MSAESERHLDRISDQMYQVAIFSAGAAVAFVGFLLAGLWAIAIVLGFCFAAEVGMLVNYYRVERAGRSPRSSHSGEILRASAPIDNYPLFEPRSTS